MKVSRKFALFSGIVGHVNASSWSFHIDCHVRDQNGNTFPQTETTNTIEVKFFDENDQTIDAAYFQGVSCPNDNGKSNFVEIITDETVKGARVEIFGIDENFVDRAYIEKDGVEQMDWEYDNREGFCLSRDEQEKDLLKNDWKGLTVKTIEGQEGCFPCIQFKSNGVFQCEEPDGGFCRR